MRALTATAGLALVASFPLEDVLSAYAETGTVVKVPVTVERR